MHPELNFLINSPDEEKSLGIVHINKSPGMLARNWLTYKMREQLLEFERKAYHSQQRASISLFKTSFNRSLAYDLKKLMLRFSNDGKLDLFDKIFVNQGILCTKTQNGNYKPKDVFM